MGGLTLEVQPGFLSYQAENGSFVYLVEQRTLLDGRPAPQVLDIPCFRTITTQQPGSDLFAPFQYQCINFQKVPNFKYFKIL